MTEKKIIGVIPARYASTRFPGKPLALIDGKPMIVHTYLSSCKSRLLNEVITATDDERIAEVIKNAGGKVIMTPSDLPSGTDRIAKALNNIECDIVVNIQGDEPFISAKAIDDAVEPLIGDDNLVVSTLIKKIEKYEDLVNTNINKVVIDKNNFALYFSHSTLPHIRDEKEMENWLNHHTFYKHIGLYVYTKSFLSLFSQMPKSKLEEMEKLEQLRILENGYKIKCIITDYENISVDTPEDLKIIEKDFSTIIK
jgi:3-deoxy-manno-octulosonate cytidylyltransferase (CMP-KDO synthetase)